jgi:hypothetical protein
MRNLAVVMGNYYNCPCEVSAGRNRNAIASRQLPLHFIVDTEDVRSLAPRSLSTLCRVAQTKPTKSSTSNNAFMREYLGCCAGWTIENLQSA